MRARFVCVCVCVCKRVRVCERACDRGGFRRGRKSTTVRVPSAAGRKGGQ